jgi:hypothetical protein
MGLVRKTLSISTLGLVSFRSKKERLRRAEADLDAANEDLEREHLARSGAEARIAAAEKRARSAELQTLKAAKDAAKLRGRKGARARSILDRLGDAATSVGSTVGEVVADAVEAAEPKVREGTRRARKRSAEARKQGRKAAKRARKQAKPYVDKVSDKVSETVDALTTR